MTKKQLMNPNSMYATACEQSKFKTQIDEWINEGKSSHWISKELRKLGEKISDKSITKYRQYREQYLQNKLMTDPVYKAQIQKMNEIIVEEVGKFKQINVLNHLAETVEHCAELIQRSKIDDIKIKNIQDLRYVQMTMLDALKLYGDTILKAQQYEKIEENPDLLRPTANIDVKQVLIDIFKEIGDEQKYAVIDKLRNNVMLDDVEVETIEEGDNDE